MLQSPVCEAAVNGHIEAVKRLMQDDANISGEEGSRQDQLSHVSALVSHVVKAILQLLKNNCVNQAMSVHNLDDVNTSVKCGADICARNVDNLQAVDTASYCGHVDIVRVLCNHLISINYFNTLENFHRYGISAFSLSSNTHTDCDDNTAVRLTTDLQYMKSLLENGADVEAENVDGLRPIHLAVRTGLVELTELLIQYGANVDAADVYGNRPLHEAVSCHGLHVVHLLVEHGATVNVQNTDGKTPLHIAVECQQSEVAVFFLNVGADVGLTDVWLNTPLHYLTAGQLQFDEHEECVVKQTVGCQHLLIRNVVGVSALSSMAAYGILDYANHKQEFANSNRADSQEELHSEQQTSAFSSVIPCLLELQHIKTFSKTKVYCRKRFSAHGLLWKHSTSLCRWSL